MSERRYLAPLPLGGRRAAVVEGADGARARGHGARRRRGPTSSPRRADADLQDAARDELDLDRLAELAGEVLGEPDAGRTMRRLRRLQALQQLDLPIVLLVGGATGTGKSTLATEAAHRLGITRVTSTDFIRQTMRAFFSREFMPSVHYSSFEAELALTKAEEEDVGRRGAARVPRPDAQRARRRRGGDRPRARRRAGRWCSRASTSSRACSRADRRGALVVQCVVAISDEDAHRSHFWVRDRHRRPAAAREVPRGHAGDPADPGRPRSSARTRFDVPVIENTSARRGGRRRCSTSC